MFRSFKIKNFRCLSDVEATDLGRVNLIAGKNNVGKKTTPNPRLLPTPSLPTPTPTNTTTSPVCRASRLVGGWW